MAINRSNIKLQVTRGNKMKMKKRKKGGSFPDVTGDGETTMKDVLVKRGVLEKKGDKFVVAKKQDGGDLTKDIKKIKERNEKRGGFDPKIAKARIRRRTVAKPKVNKPRQIIKRKGGGMAYQLYGGSTKNISNGNKFIQSFYDKE